MPVLLNPKRKTDGNRVGGRKFSWLFAPLIYVGAHLGFRHVDYAYVHGDLRRLHVGARCSTMDTLFNVVSGEIHIGDDTYFGHDCQVLTGEHRFVNGRRAGLDPDATIDEVPDSGNDITIGARCFIASGVVIMGGVTIGDDVLIGAGSVVTKDLPSGVFAAGVPARVVRRMTEDAAPSTDPRPVA